MKIGLKKGLLVLTLIGIFILLPGLVSILNAYADVVIIANQSVASEVLTQSALKDIFLGNTLKWDNNEKINIVVQRKSEAHDEFVKKITKKSSSQFKNYWKKMVFTGKGSAPKSFKEVSGLIEYVAKTEGAIGYISAEDGTEGVKVITIK